MKRLFVTICLALMLCACGSQNNVFNIEREGVIYNYSNKISFYYPRNWTFLKDTLKFSIDITSQSEEEGLYFDTYEVNTTNSEEELLALYRSQLSNLGYDITRTFHSNLSNGSDCTYISGESKKDDLAFFEVVVFADNKQYTYSYIAHKDIYKDNIDVMKSYIESLVVSGTQK